jgi:hypothetical protein
MKKMAAVSGGHFTIAKQNASRNAIIVNEEKRPWQAWQRPTLPSLET